MVSDLVRKQHEFFSTGRTRDVAYRIEQLERLKSAIRKHEPEIMTALKADMSKPDFEAYTGEIAMVVEEIQFAISNVSKWAKPRKVRTPIMHFFSTSRIYSEPVGVTLVIAPWNYPFQLCLAPLVASLAAGNCAVLKPSELAPATSKIITKIISETFDPAYVVSVEGGVDVTTALLKERFDHIFFTGGTNVGRIVMEAASKNLTPVTLELGGKSPCIVDKDVNLELTARRIAWGKFYNAGQTCVAPDYLLVHRSVKKEFIEALAKVLREFYGANPAASKDYARIINDRHFARLSALLKGATVAVGGQTDAAARFIAPTVLDNVKLDDAVMADEIFGPILPVLAYDSLDQAIATIHQRPKPLALYVFTNDSETEKRVLRDVQFGGGCVNDTLIHLSTSHMPFGGIGPSGMGAYHGRAGFDLFSHRKSVLKKSSLFDVKIRYAPYSPRKLALVKKLFA